MRGEPAAGYVAKNDRLTAAVFFLNAELGAELTSWLWWRGSLLGGTTAPRPDVRFNGHEVAAWGRSFAAAVVAFDFVIDPAAGADGAGEH